MGHTANRFQTNSHKLGFDKLELVVSGGAALPAETMALWHIYGSMSSRCTGRPRRPEASSLASVGPFPHPGNVGTPADGLEVRLGPDSEILVLGPDLSKAICAIRKQRAKCLVRTVGSGPEISGSGMTAICVWSIGLAIL